MEKYELDKNYEDDEINLVDLLKTIIKEKTLIIFTTILCILLAGSFAFYKNNKSYNYGVNITLSDETLNKINQYNSMYKNINIDLNNIIQESFNTLLNTKDSNLIILPSDDIQKINQTLEKEYNFIKIIDVKNKSYKLFTKTKIKDMKKNIPKINEILNNDLILLNSNFNNILSENIKFIEFHLLNTTIEVEKLNKKIISVINKDLKNTTKEDLNSNLSIISPILYIEYEEKIKDLDILYSKMLNLKKIKEDVNNLFEFSGKKNIIKITLENTSPKKEINNKIILIIGAFIGLFIGMFLAIIKEPLKNILFEIKKEK